MEKGPKCFVEAVRASREGYDNADRYLAQKLDDVPAAAPNTVGEPVDCDRCLSAFRLNAGGVYLDTESDCQFSAGKGLERYDYVGSLGSG